MSTTSIIHPQHFLIIERRDGSWYFKYGQLFYNGSGQPVQEHDRERLFGITKNQIVIELFRISAGKPGYYLANVRDKKYYYCGDDWVNIKSKLLELGIGRNEPDYES